MKNLFLLGLSLIWAAGWFTVCERVDMARPDLWCVAAIMGWCLMMAMGEYLFSSKDEQKAIIRNW